MSFYAKGKNKPNTECLKNATNKCNIEGGNDDDSFYESDIYYIDTDKDALSSLTSQNGLSLEIQYPKIILDNHNYIYVFGGLDGVDSLKSILYSNQLISPTINPTADPTSDPTSDPTTDPTSHPTINPSIAPTTLPSEQPTEDPTPIPVSKADTPGMN